MSTRDGMHRRGNSTMPRRRHSLRSPVLAAMLLAGVTLSGCTAVGTVAGFLAGAALGGPEGAVAGAEAGLYLGAAIDLSILEGLACEEPDERYADQEWYAEDALSTVPPPDSSPADR